MRRRTVIRDARNIEASCLGLASSLTSGRPLNNGRTAETVACPKSGGELKVPSIQTSKNAVGR